MEEIKKVLLLVLGCAVQVGLLSGWGGFRVASPSLRRLLGNNVATVCCARHLEVQTPSGRDSIPCARYSLWARSQAPVFVSRFS